MIFFVAMSDDEKLTRNPSPKSNGISRVLDANWKSKTSSIAPTSLVPHGLEKMPSSSSSSSSSSFNSDSLIKKKKVESTYGSNYKDLLNLLKPEYKRLLLGVTGMIISSATNLMFPKIMGKAVDVASGKPPPYGLTERHFVYSTFSLFTLGACGSFLRVYSFAVVAQRVAARLRKRLYSAILRQDMEFFHNRRAGELTCRLNEEVQVVALSTVDIFASVCRSLNSAIGGSIMLFCISRKLTLASLGIIPLVGSTAMLYSKYAARLTRKFQDSVAKLVGVAEERINNIMTVRLFAREQLEEDTFAIEVDEVMKLAMAAKASRGVFMGSLSFAVSSCLFSVLYLGGSLVKRGEMSIGSLTSFAIYSGFMGLGFSGLAGCFGDIKRSLIAVQSIFEILNSNPIDKEENLTCLEYLKGHIVFDNVSFSYPSRPQIKVLQHLQLEIQQGQVIAIVGTSGCGKTTIANLLTGLYQPTSGSILIDGVDSKSLDPISLRKQIGIVNQEPCLFSGTFAENIRYGKIDATLDEMIQAAKEANIHEYIQSLPNGYDTSIGGKGLQLSGGQKQRVAIARAILKNPKILILDEATSSLDKESANVVQQALENAMKGRTSIVISHSKEAIENTETVAVLQKGKIVEHGKYLDLYNQQTALYQLVALDSALHNIEQMS